jgi:hypothetical protein
MRYRLRTLLILMAVLPPLIGGPIAAYMALDRWVKGEYAKVFARQRAERAAAKAESD